MNFLHVFLMILSILLGATSLMAALFYGFLLFTRLSIKRPILACVAFVVYLSIIISLPVWWFNQ